MALGDLRGRHGEIGKLHATVTRGALKAEARGGDGVLTASAKAAGERAPCGKYLQNIGNYFAAERSRLSHLGRQ
jgi:hypothetical protein